MRRLHADGAPAFDVMLEAKAKDLALRRLRSDLQRYAPDVAARFGLASKPLTDETKEIVLPPTPTSGKTMGVSGEEAVAG